MSKPLAELNAGLTHADVDVRIQAAEKLAQLGEDAQPAALALLRACQDDDETVREHVVAALEGLGPPALADLPGLLALLAEKHADGVYWTATLIGRLASDAAPATPALVQLLGESHPPAVRQRAAWALGQIGAGAAAARAPLAKLTTSADARLARLAQEALTQIGA